MCDRYCAPNCQNPKCMAATIQAEPCAFRVGDVCQKRDAPGSGYAKVIYITAREVVFEYPNGSVMCTSLAGYCPVGFYMSPLKRTKTEVRYVGMMSASSTPLQWYAIVYSEHEWQKMGAEVRSRLVDVKRIEFEVPC